MKGMVSMILFMTVLNASVGSTAALVATGVVVFLGKSEVRARMVVESVYKGFDSVELEYKGGDNLIGASPPAVD